MKVDVLKTCISLHVPLTYSYVLCIQKLNDEMGEIIE